MIDMSDRFFNDPEGFANGSALFPCNTQFMRYEPLLHRYFLTPQALEHYGVDTSGLNADEIRQFIEKISKKVYGTVFYKSGHRNYQIMLYRIAAAPKTLFKTNMLKVKYYGQ